MHVAQTIHTAFGRIPLVGGLSNDPSRPVLLVIRGLFLPPDYLEWIVDELAPEVDVLLAHLPGLHSPTLTRSDVPTITAAFAEVLAQTVSNREVVLAGISAGCLTTLGLAHEPMIRRLVLIEPFLDVQRCWALREYAGLKAPKQSLLRAWLEAYLGPDLAGDFRHLAGRAPSGTRVLVGDTPLDPPRSLNALPSLASDADRSLWASQLGVELLVCRDAGHDIPGRARSELLSVIRAALADLRTGAQLA